MPRWSGPQTTRSRSWRTTTICKHCSCFWAEVSEVRAEVQPTWVNPGMDLEAQMDRNWNCETDTSASSWQKQEADIVEEDNLPLARTKPVPAAAPKRARVLAAEANEYFFFHLQNSLFSPILSFFAKWGLFFAKWGLLFTSLYVHKSPAVLLNLGNPIAPLHHCCCCRPNLKLLSLCEAEAQRMADICSSVQRRYKFSHSAFSS